MNGKGDSPRPCNRDVYEENYDSIDWNRESSQIRPGDLREPRLEDKSFEVSKESESIHHSHQEKPKDHRQGFRP